MDKNTKDTIIFALIMVFIIGSLLSVAIWNTIQDAEAEHPIEDSFGLSVSQVRMEAHEYGIRFCEDDCMGKLIYRVEHILEEEKKQTALLDHIDCILNENMRYIQPYLIVGLSNCGTYPLNVTGVWQP